VLRVGCVTLGCGKLALLLSALACILLMVVSASASATYRGVLAWGASEAGQLGDGTNAGPEDCYLGFLEPCSVVPVSVTGLSEATSIAAGGEHGLALQNNGTVVSWGDNSYGQLGAGEVTINGPNTEGLYSEEVTGPETCEEFRDAVDYFPCSVTPIAVGGLHEVKQIAAGGAFSLALLKDGTVMAWGYNEAGVLGNFTTKISTVPAAVGGLSEVAAIAAGSNYALALLKTGTVMAWGDNGSGQLGDGGAQSYSDVPVAVSGLSEVVAITAGGQQSLALLKDGTVMAWGANGAGQLGDGSTTRSDVPVAVSAISEATAVTSGERSSFALLKDGSVMAWGENEDEGAKGELGDGTETSSDVPVAVCAVGEQAPCARQLSGATLIAAGSGHTLALLGNGTVVAWGSSRQGRLGDGYLDVTPDGGVVGSKVPVPVDGLSEATAISAGGDFSLASGTLAALPTLIRLDPESGPVSGGTPVRITGSNFTGVRAVKFGSTTASFTVDSETEITAVSPPGTGMAYVEVPGATVTPPGTVYVTVQSTAGTSPARTTRDLFAYGPLETDPPTSSGSGQPRGAGGSQPEGASSWPGGSVLATNAIGDPIGKTVTPKSLTRAQKLARALKKCDKDKSKTKRAVCKKQARKKYATTAKKVRKQQRRQRRRH
jgi:alpha-tubulin suppressor-like RCC1 family protein